jgi:hypothetical protein
MTASKAFGTSKSNFVFTDCFRGYTVLATAVRLSAAIRLSYRLTASHLSDAMPNASRVICISVLLTFRIALDAYCTFAPPGLQYFSSQIKGIQSRLYRYYIRLGNFYKQ